MEAFSWSDLDLFVVAATSASFSAAAARRRLNQSTLSRRIAVLEGVVGSALFHRSRRGLRLTSAGERLLPLAEQVAAKVADFTRAAAGVSDEVEGRVRIDTVEEVGTYVLAPALARFTARWPKLEVELVSRAAVADLARRDADIAVRAFRPDRGDLFVRKLVDLPCSVFAAQRYLGQGKRKLGVLEWLELDESLTFAPERSYLDTKQPRRRTRLWATSTASLAEACAAGLGAAVLPEALARRHRLTKLSGPVAYRPLYLVVHRDLRDVPRVRCTMEWISEEVARLGRA